MVILCPARAFITLPPARTCHLCHARAQRWFCYDQVHHQSTSPPQGHTSPPPDHNSVTTKSTIGLKRHCMFFFSKNHWIPQTWSHVTLPRIKPHDIMSMVTTKWWQTLASPQGGRCFVENLVLLCSTPPLQVSSSITLYSRPALHKTICVLNYRTFFFHYWWMLLVLVHLV